VTAARVYPYRARGQAAQWWDVRAWPSLHMQTHAEAQRPYLTINLYPEDPWDGEGGLVLRPGRRRFTAGSTAARLASNVGAQLIFDANFGQSLVKTVVVAGGQIYSLNWTAKTITTEITTAQLTAASITLSSTVQCYACMFGNVMVICDANTNRPFTWNGTTGVGLTSLTNGPARVVGAPTVFYAKLFFIKGTDHLTVVWSEENQANTGYEAGGFNNAWSLTQTGRSWLTAIQGTNEGLYYFRNTSVGVIRGAVTTDFQTAGVHDDISQVYGCENASNVLFAQNTLYWADPGARLFRYTPGGGAPLELTQQLINFSRHRSMGLQGADNLDVQSPWNADESTTGELRGVFTGAKGVTFNPVLQQVRLAVVGAATTNLLVLFDARTGQFQGIWHYAAGTSIATNYGALVVATDTTNGAAQLTQSDVMTDTLGYVFWAPLGDRTQAETRYADEVFNSAGSAFAGSLIGPMHGRSEAADWHFDRLDVSLITRVGSNVVTVRGHTPRQTGTLLSQVVADGNNAERRFSFGLNLNGRWCVPVIKVNGATDGVSRWTILGYALRGRRASETPRTK